VGNPEGANAKLQKVGYGMSQPVCIFGHGYLAHALAKECHARRIEVIDNKIPAHALTYETIKAIINHRVPFMVANCAAFIPSPTVDACKDDPEQNIHGNVLLPAALSHACRELDVPLTHLSTGCLFDEQREYTEEDTPTRGWDGYCGAYVGAKLMAEKVVLEHPESYVLRIRLPFDEQDHPRNYLSKLARFDEVFDHVNSLTHRGDFAKAAVDLWQRQAEWGIYHVVNPRQIGTVTITARLQINGVRVPGWRVRKTKDTTGCRLSTDKLRKAGIIMRPVEEAVNEAIKNWRKA
jgi:dTDP-4-dehydrorhamnose reductase